MAEAAARRPAGKVSAVFTRSKEREGAYDFLESPHAPRAAFAESMFMCTAGRDDLERRFSVEDRHVGVQEPIERVFLAASSVFLADEDSE
jgi:hypothetical protein